MPFGRLRQQTSDHMIPSKRMPRHVTPRQADAAAVRKRAELGSSPDGAKQRSEHKFRHTEWGVQAKANRRHDGQGERGGPFYSETRANLG